MLKASVSFISSPKQLVSQGIEKGIIFQPENIHMKWSLMNFQLKLTGEYLRKVVSRGLQDVIPAFGFQHNFTIIRQDDRTNGQVVRGNRREDECT